MLFAVLIFIFGQLFEERLLLIDVVYKFDQVVIRKEQSLSLVIPLLDEIRRLLEQVEFDLLDLFLESIDVRVKLHQIRENCL